jgi:serine/threonine protein kinase
MLDLAQAPRAEDDAEWRRVLFAGAVIGRFELVQEIGRGGFGLVFEAKDRELGRRVAFKAVKPGRFSQVRLRKEQLQREAEAIAQLSHPNIVQLYDVGRCESGPYLILELLRGETLHGRLRSGPLPLKGAIDVAIDVAWALEHAHAAGIVHRDLKPSNVFLCEGGRVKVLDFGIAHVFGDGETRALGTPAYMAPEQWREGSQDSRTDVFGAAAMLFESLTGRLPYEVTPEWSSVLDDGARPAVRGAGLPARVEALLEAALDPSPGARPRDGAAWLEALIGIQAELDPVERRAAAPAAAPDRRLLLGGLVALATAAAAALAWAVLSR